MGAAYALLLVSGICQGSFGLGYKKYSPFSWEAFWWVYSLCCIVVSVLWAAFAQPDFGVILAQAGFSDLWLPVLCGVVWGLSTIAFSKSVLLIGMSLCFGINMGTSAAVGSVIPFFFSGKQPSAASVGFLLGGLAVTLAGIGVITKAGLMKEQAQKTANAKAGIGLAVLSGLCSGIMNVGFDKAAPLGAHATNPTAAAAVQWLPVLVGGMAASMVCCTVMIFRRKTWHTFRVKGAARRTGILFLTSVVWLAALALYGVSAKMIGSTGSSVCWLIFNALALIISNLWGLKTGEWQGCGKAKKVLFGGDLIILASWLLILNV